VPFWFADLFLIRRCSGLPMCAVILVRLAAESDPESAPIPDPHPPVWRIRHGWDDVVVVPEVGRVAHLCALAKVGTDAAAPHLLVVPLA
jgi:hypothetical protein